MVKVQDFIKTLNLQVLSPTTREEWEIPSVELNRPGLQFVGFYEYFAYERPQVVGKVEMTYLESASASFFIEEQQLVGITYRNNVPFTMYPLALIPESQPTRLKNFKWVPELRPTKEMVFNRTLRPSEREERTQRRRPTFSIVERMDRYKERLIMSGDWEDREDQLTPELIEWRNRNLQK